MLSVAGAKHPEVPTQKVGLQEMDFDAEFDAVICIDAMEYVFPEDWPRVLRNLRRAVRPGGPVYFTVETIDEREIEAVFADAIGRRTPGRPRRALHPRGRVPVLSAARAGRRVDRRSGLDRGRERPERRQQVWLLPRAVQIGMKPQGSVTT
jgi:cyclopropane fatty-acyl-phospholipid synthase-like methyltransferase